MIKLRIAAAAAMLASAGAAVGGNVSATIGLTSDYDFRGVSQTLNDPAFQVGLTYTADIGVYYGIWGSNVDFQNGDEISNDPVAYPSRGDLDRASTEIDVFMGYSGEKVVGYDFGLIYYTYPNFGTINSPELYAGITKGPGTLKVWYSWDYANSGKSEIYTEGNLNVPMAEGFSFLGHVGYSKFQASLGADNYMDWSLGFGYDASNFNVSFKYVDGSDLKLGADVPNNLGRFVFSASTTLPWGE